MAQIHNVPVMSDLAAHLEAPRSVLSKTGSCKSWLYRTGRPGSISRQKSLASSPIRCEALIQHTGGHTFILERGLGHVGVDELRPVSADTVTYYPATSQFGLACNVFAASFFLSGCCPNRATSPIQYSSLLRASYSPLFQSSRHLAGIHPRYRNSPFFITQGTSQIFERSCDRPARQEAEPVQV